MLLVDAKTMQEMDRHTIEAVGIPGIVLMENAGRGCTDVLLKEFGSIVHDGCLVVAGPGNNGGDGFVIARYLEQRQCKVNIICLCNLEKFRGDALANLNICQNLKIKIHECPDEETLNKRQAIFDSSAVIVDAIFGTGLSREIRGHYATAVSMINSSSAKVLSVDIASGLSSDTGIYSEPL
ncbi:MAG: NAD(P)H-hydrate epimerase [Thermodesulfatator sp.]|nr:MAG: NAD(P)H-hydrate epimerase [Thermodesulfatator sp.]